MKTKNPRTQNFCKNSRKPCQINYKKQKGTISWLHPSKKGMEWFTVNRVLKVQGQMRIPVIIQPSPQPDTNITKNILTILYNPPLLPHQPSHVHPTPLFVEMKFCIFTPIFSLRNHDFFRAVMTFFRHAGKSRLVYAPQFLFWPPGL